MNEDLRIQKIIDYVREMHNIVPKVEKAINTQTKQFLIDKAIKLM